LRTANLSALPVQQRNHPIERRIQARIMISHECGLEMRVHDQASRTHLNRPGQRHELKLPSQSVSSALTP